MSRVPAVYFSADALHNVVRSSLGDYQGHIDTTNEEDVELFMAFVEHNMISSSTFAVSDNVAEFAVGMEQRIRDDFSGSLLSTHDHPYRRFKEYLGLSLYRLEHAIAEGDPLLLREIAAHIAAGAILYADVLFLGAGEKETVLGTVG